MAAVNLIVSSRAVPRGLLRILFVSKEVNVLPIAFRNRVNFRVGAAKDVRVPRFVLGSYQVLPVLEVLVLSINDAGLPLFIVADLVIRVEPVMTVVLGLLVPLRLVVHFQGSLLYL